MTAILQWTTANPFRAFLAAGSPRLVVALRAAMARGCRRASSCSACSQAARRSRWRQARARRCSRWCGRSRPCSVRGAGVPPRRAAPLPSALAAVVLEKSRSLSFVYQCADVGVVPAACSRSTACSATRCARCSGHREARADAAAHARRCRRWASRVSPEADRQRPRASPGRRSAGWCSLHAFLAQCAGLWAFGRMREPGLFGREFRRSARRVHRLDCWSPPSSRLRLHRHDRGPAGRPIEDVLFVLAAAFLVQALAVVHGLREMQVIGVVPVILAYVGGAAGAEGPGGHRFRGYLGPLSRAIWAQGV